MSGLRPTAISLRALAYVTAAIALGGCDRRQDAGAVVVSAIGSVPGLADPARGPQSTASRLLLDATAQGLVRFDANGQIEPTAAMSSHRFRAWLDEEVAAPAWREQLEASRQPDLFA